MSGSVHAIGKCATRAMLLAVPLLLWPGIALAQTERMLADPAPCQPGTLIATTLFGRALAVLESDLAVSAGGAGCDSVLDGRGLVYRIDPGTGAVVRSFANPTPGAGDFGAALAPLGANLVVGAPWSAGTGAAYLFDGATAAQLRSFSSPSPSTDDRFGSAVAVAGGAVLVGAPLDDTGAQDAGAAFLFDAGTGALIRSFANPSPGARFFGSAVAALGSNPLVGAPSFADPGGAVHLLDAATGAVRRTFPNPTGTSSDFGVAVAAVGTAVVVGAPREGADAADAVYLFDSASGALLHTFVSPRPDPFDGFGTAVAAIGSDLLVGAPGTLADKDGAAYLFDADPASPGFGRLRQTFLKAHLDGSVALSNFGAALAARGSQPVVGAPGYPSNLGLSAGAVYLFDACGNGVPGAAEQCDDGNRVDGDGCSAGCALELCGPTPAVGCRRGPTGQSSLVLKHPASPGTEHAKDQLVWRWVGLAGPAADFGDPRATASYALCIYDAAATAQPRADDAAPAGGTCGPRPCWSPTGALRYRDALLTPNGILTIALRPDPITLLRLRGKGAALLLPRLPLTAPVTVQVRNTGTGVCWEAVYAGQMRSNTSALFKASSD